MLAEVGNDSTNLIGEIKMNVKQKTNQTSPFSGDSKVLVTIRNPKVIAMIAKY